jgi:endoglucanase
MDGGTCEATAAIAFGFKAMGISIPLGNYHNQSFEGGPESRGEWGPAPEFVHITDIEGMLSLCDSLMKSDLPWQEPWKKRKMALKRQRK